MNLPTPPTRRLQPRRRILFGLAAIVVVFAAVVTAVPGCRRPLDNRWSDTDVPLGVEEAVIIRYAGPRLVPRPYRRGASINLRVAEEMEQGEIRVYDVRYVVNLPGEFDLTEYLTSADGRSIDDLPSFKIRGLPSLTKDIETRIRQIEDVDIRFWHGYYETLVGLGAFWGLWLMALVFVARGKRTTQEKPPPPEPSPAERIARLLRQLADGGLTTEQKAELEILLLTRWREDLGLDDRRLADACPRIRGSGQLGRAYRRLETWLHDPKHTVAVEDLLEDLTPSASDGKPHTRPPVPS